MSPGKILIVEDEMELAELLGYNLRKEGYDVICAHDGLSACCLFEGERPDLVLLDILLPDFDGWEICRLIRNHPEAALASRPIVMMTALGTTDQRLKGLELGADAYLAKPYVMRELLLKVRRLMARQRDHGIMATEVKTLRNGAELQADLQALLLHELTNQLMVVGGFSGVLSRESRLVPPQECLQAIQRSTLYLSSLAEGFLLIRRLESGAFELPLAEVSLSALLNELTQLYRPRAAVTCTVVQTPGENLPHLWSHPAAVRVILSTLIENAIKYSGDNAEVQLRLDGTASGELRVEVRDNGTGIPAGEIGRIFGHCFRGQSAIGKTSGSGLGLYLARTLARHLGGDVAVRDTPEPGACFEVRLPLSEKPAVALG